MIRYLQLPFQFDAARMSREIERLLATWRPHFNKRDYEGSWSGIALRAPGGSQDNLLAENLTGNNPFEDTPLLQQCPYIREVLQMIKCPQTSIRLLKLDRGAIIKEHTDTGLNFEEGEVRFHIPVHTHELVEFYVDGERLSMKEGECWYINASLPHRLANPSPVDRIHLVVDCLVNDWLKDWFIRTDLPVKNIKDTSAADNEKLLQVIDELRRSGSPNNLRLANELEGKLVKAAAIDVTAMLTTFIESIGIEVRYGELNTDTFLPGIAIEHGTIVIDKDKLKYPGDLLHEAGHIAVVPLAERPSLTAETIGKRKDHAAEEMMAMAWSYAACHHLEIDPGIVFHAEGYKGGSESLLQSLSSPMPIGSPMLQYVGMTWNTKLAAEQNVAPYPAMTRWTRE